VLFVTPAKASGCVRKPSARSPQFAISKGLQFQKIEDPRQKGRITRPFWY
jgi:hypothetical protein